jgi:hypothetical protein
MVHRFDVDSPDRSGDMVHRFDVDSPDRRGHHTCAAADASSGPSSREPRSRNQVTSPDETR